MLLTMAVTTASAALTSSVKAASPTDWVDARLVLPAAANAVDVYAHLSGKDAGQEIIGVGISSPLGALTTVSVIGLLQPGVTTTRQLGGVNIQLLKTSLFTYLFEGHEGWPGPFHAGDLFTAVFFLPGATIEHMQLTATVNQQPVPIAVKAGPGAGVVHIGAPDSGGAGAATPAASAGSVSPAQSPSAGLIGALPLGCLVTSCSHTAVARRSLSYLYHGRCRQLRGDGVQGASFLRWRQRRVAMVVRGCQRQRCHRRPRPHRRRLAAVQGLTPTAMSRRRGVRHDRCVAVEKIPHTGDAPRPSRRKD
jgi:hypothetical protein